MSRRKVGLALSSGAARGLAHIGVLEVLEREGIPVDMIAGSSMGALVGAVYAQGKDVAQMTKLAIDWGAKRVSLLADPALSRTGLIRGRKIENMLASIIGDIEFSDLKVPFACVATDIHSGEEVVIRCGLVREGVRASGSIPVILTAAKRQGRYMVDGALVNPVPVSVVRAMGADFVVAVSVISHGIQRKAKEPNILNVMMQTLDIYSNTITKSSLSGADVVIEPQVASIGYFDFHRAQECILQGVSAAQESIPEIKGKYAAKGLNTLLP